MRFGRIPSWFVGLKDAKLRMAVRTSCDARWWILSFKKRLAVVVVRGWWWKGVVVRSHGIIT